jgi:hypothetical protein
MDSEWNTDRRRGVGDQSKGENSIPRDGIPRGRVFAVLNVRNLSFSSVMSRRRTRGVMPSRFKARFGCEMDPLWVSSATYGGGGGVRWVVEESCGKGALRPRGIPTEEL